MSARITVINTQTNLTSEIPTITLHLTTDQATTLRDILSNVGGVADLTRRKYADQISDKLTKLGIEYLYLGRTSDIDGSIYFK